LTLLAYIGFCHEVEAWQSSQADAVTQAMVAPPPHATDRRDAGTMLDIESTSPERLSGFQD
jgi:hypothetical protein